MGGLSTAALATNDPELQAQSNPSSAYALHDNAFTNDHYLAYAGFYHAPYRAWFPLRYNHYDAQQQMYFLGGQWTQQPHQSITNISAPSPEALAAAQAAQPRPPVNTSSTTTSHGGFGSTAHWFGSGSTGS